MKGLGDLIQKIEGYGLPDYEVIFFRETERNTFIIEFKKAEKADKEEKRK